MGRRRSSEVEHTLGKGGVGCSIHPGGTIFRPGARTLRRYANLLLLTASLVVGLVGAEGAYRLWLAWKLRALAAPVTDDPRPSFGVYNTPPWRFDREAGFGYIPELSYWTAHIRDGAFGGCTPPVVMTNAQGNIGKIYGSYDTAEIRILVFADSFGTMHYDGDTWPNLLQRKLERATGKSVHVVNFGRDSYGLLQMMDLAAREVPQWRPDYVIFAYITNDLVRPRAWRILKEVRGHWRFIMAMEPNEDIEPGPDTSTNEMGLINPGITRAWCDAMAARLARGETAAARDDPVVQDLVRQYNTIRRENARQIVDPADVDLWWPFRSYLYNRIVHADTFHETGVRPRRVGHVPIEETDFRRDKRFVDAAAKVLATGARPILIHFPVLPEIESGTQYVWGKAGATTAKQGSGLVSSLEEILGTKSVNLLAYLPMPMRDFKPYVASPQDWHPNARGIELYADAVLKALLALGIADPPPRRAAPRP